MSFIQSIIVGSTMCYSPLESYLGLLCLVLNSGTLILKLLCFFKERIFI